MNHQVFLRDLAAAMVAACVGFVSCVSMAANDGQPNRVFEIRTYTTEPGKLDALQARFRDHTRQLFEQHGMTNIGYWTPADEPRSQDTLIYIIAHESRAAAKQNWEAFIDDPAWIKARDESEASGKIVNKIESVFVEPTDFSPIH